MFRIHAVQALFGDCLVLEYGGAAAKVFALVDGGPPGAYAHLKKAFAGLAVGDLEFAMLSHVDNDHVIGLLDFLADKAVDPTLPKVVELWHNAFGAAVDPADALGPRMAALAVHANMANMASASEEVLGIKEGANLQARASALGIPLNVAAGGKPVTVDGAGAAVNRKGLKLTVVGPTKRNLAELKKKWEAWLQKAENAVMDGTASVLANADKSVPNLSSIMVLAEHGGRTALLTGDGRSGHLIEGLDKQGLLDDAGMLHVNLLKVAHHGSDRNQTKAFFSRVTADKYLISADGTNGNPDSATLEWIVEAADEDGRHIEIFVTNDPPSTQKLRQDYKPATYGYKLTTMAAGKHWMSVDV